MNQKENPKRKINQQGVKKSQKRLITENEMWTRMLLLFQCEFITEKIVQRTGTWPFNPFWQLTFDKFKICILEFQANPKEMQNRHV